MVAEVKL